MQIVEYLKILKAIAKHQESNKSNKSETSDNLNPHLNEVLVIENFIEAQINNSNYCYCKYFDELNELISDCKLKEDENKEIHDLQNLIKKFFQRFM